MLKIGVISMNNNQFIPSDNEVVEDKNSVNEKNNQEFQKVIYNA